jgi:hypothetical protein
MNMEMRELSMDELDAVSGGMKPGDVRTTTALEFAGKGTLEFGYSVTNGVMIPHATWHPA